MKKTSEGWLLFLKLCLDIESPEELAQMLELFLTIEEKKQLGARFLILKALLEDEITQREIAKNFHVSIAQITRGSNALKQISPTLKKFLKERMTG